MATDFYKALYQSEGTTNMECVLGTVPPKVIAEMNEVLVVPFEKDEVKKALFHMFSTKALGPDGMPAHFSNAIGIYAGTW
jgi:hypothetical protein